MKNKIFLEVVIFAIAATILLAGCTNPNQPKSEPIMIGAPLSLTGATASFGERVRNSMEIAIKEINSEQATFELIPVYEDTQSETAKAVDSAKKLIEIDKVNILFGVVRSNEVMAIAPLTEEKKIILFTPMAGSDAISSAGDFVFRNRETASLHGKQMAEFLFQKGFRNIAIVRAESENSISYAKFFSKRFEELGGKIVFNSAYNEKETDFRTIISQIMEKNPESIYLSPAADKDGGFFVKQLGEMGFSGQIASSISIEGPGFIKNAGEAAENTLITYPTLDKTNPKAEEFSKKYFSQYGSEPDFVAANSYDGIRILFNAIIFCNSDEPACIRDYLYSVKDYNGIGGNTTFDSNGDVIKPLTIEIMHNGEFVKYEK
ncbi:MAG: ABC transporter substrate-binding protein [Candidatus ainarchaeum sp.]|nr:ABC transporter substrate-binding protein [Candidatus ainarchaeum sp.]